MAGIRKINDLTVINDEANITGTEKVLVEKEGVATLIPMNMIKASGGGGSFIIDTTSPDYKPNYAAYGDMIKELIRSGVTIIIYNGFEYITIVRWKLWDSSGEYKLAGYYIDSVGTYSFKCSSANWS